MSGQLNCLGEPHRNEAISLLGSLDDPFSLDDCDGYSLDTTLLCSAHEVYNFALQLVRFQEFESLCKNENVSFLTALIKKENVPPLLT